MQKKINWKELKDSIPAIVQISAKTKYNVVWSKDIQIGKDKCLGATISQKKLIMIQLGQTDKESVLTYLHEIVHAISDENDLYLTERQVQGLEDSIYYLLKQDNLFKKD